MASGTLQALSRQSKQLVEELRSKPSGSVRKKTGAVVAGEAVGSELTKTKYLGVPMQPESWLLVLSRPQQQTSSEPSVSSNSSGIIASGEVQPINSGLGLMEHYLGI